MSLVSSLRSLSEAVAFANRLEPTGRTQNDLDWAVWSGWNLSYLEMAYVFAAYLYLLCYCDF